jgi:hypothetical protein
MNSRQIILSLAAMSGATLIALTAGIFTARTGNAQMKSDVTIYLQPPILGGGGTIFVLPNEVSVEEWRKETGLSNPALKDLRLLSGKPISGEDRRFGAVVTDPVSVIKFDFPSGGSFVFRPLPSLDSGYPTERQSSRVISVGRAGDIHPRTGEDVDIAKVQVLHIYGDLVSEEQSQRIFESVRLGFLEERYDCENFEHVIACAASKDKLNE